MSFKIKVRNVHPYKDITIKTDDTTIELGLYNNSNLKELAGDLLSDIWDMGPVSQDECKAWFKELLENKGIDLT